MKKVAVLGSTGSIGVNALKVIEVHKHEFCVESLSTYGNTKLLAEQIKKFKPKAVCVVDSEKIADLKKRVSLKNIKVFSTNIGNEILAESKKVDYVVMAVSGSCALNPILLAIKAKKRICLANKEAIVIAGEIIMRAAKKNKAMVLPVDSEHSAIFQCLSQAREKQALSKIYLTGSGGSLRNIPKSGFSKLKKSFILKHPKWNMGPKITIDSATLMNKGLEVIEAKHLFNIQANKIKVLIHPEAIVHSMVEFSDGAVLAQLGVTDMKLPIEYALMFPKRSKNALARLDFNTIKNLSFGEPDIKKFPCFSLANVACKLGGTYPAALNAANEVVVQAFLKEKIKFPDIPKIIEKVLIKHKSIADPLLGDILSADAWAREETEVFI